MHRFIVSPEALSRGVVTLGESDSHHAAVVLRLESGEVVTLLDGEGTVAKGLAQKVTKRSVDIEVQERRVLPRRAWEVVLVTAVTKGKAWDALLQKGTELDVAGIVPLLTRNCVVKVAREERARRRQDWQAAVAEAAKQCGTPWLPKVSDPVAIDEWLAGNPRFDVGMVAALAPGAGEMGDIMAQNAGARRVGVVIGPEGDFDAAELKALTGAGFHPVTLGNTVLRADTAALAAAAVIGHELRRRWRA
jgi:16S rRNA (uracil1498-N3)-methyltransferase